MRLTINKPVIAATNVTTVHMFKKKSAVKVFNSFCNKVYKPFVSGVVNSPVLIFFGIFGDDVTFDVGVINDAFVEPILTLQTAIIQICL